MAEIVIDDMNKTVAAVLTEPEYAIVSQALAAPGGKEGLQSMFASFLQQQYQVQVEQQRAAIKKFADTATDQQRADVLAIINRKG